MEKYISNEDPSLLFDLQEELAEGSFGVVYKGIYKPSSSVVAVKVIKLDDDETFDDLLSEIEILHMCDSPFVVKYYGAYKQQNELFIAMECCEGGSCLEAMTDLGRPFSEKAAAHIGHLSLRGLLYLNSIAIMHRDIKAANILITDKGEAKLADFGVSGRLEQNRKNRRNSFVGSPYWMAPDVVYAHSHGQTYDEKIDIWSLGVTLIELVEKRAPLQHLHPMTAVFQTPQLAPPTVRQPERYSQVFQDFIARACVHDPSKRATAQQLLAHPMCALPPAYDDVSQFVWAAKQRAALQKQTVKPTGAGGTVKPGNRPTTHRVNAQDAEARKRENQLRKLAAREMKKIAKLKRQQSKAREKLKAYADNEVAKLKKGFNQNMKNSMKTKAQEEQKVVSELKTQMAHIKQKHDAQLKGLSRAQENEMKSKLRAHKDKMKKNGTPPNMVVLYEMQQRCKLTMHFLGVQHMHALEQLKQTHGLDRDNHQKRYNILQRATSRQHQLQLDMVVRFNRLSIKQRIDTHALKVHHLQELQQLEMQEKQKQAQGDADVRQVYEKLHADQRRALDQEPARTEAAFKAQCQQHLLRHERAAAEDILRNMTQFRNESIKMFEVQHHTVLQLVNRHRGERLQLFGRLQRAEVLETRRVFAQQQRTLEQRLQVMQHEQDAMVQDIDNHLRALGAKLQDDIQTFVRNQDQLIQSFRASKQHIFQPRARAATQPQQRRLSVSVPQKPNRQHKNPRPVSMVMSPQLPAQQRPQINANQGQSYNTAGSYSTMMTAQSYSQPPDQDDDDNVINDVYAKVLGPEQDDDDEPPPIVYEQSGMISPDTYSPLPQHGTSLQYTDLGPEGVDMQLLAAPSPQPDDALAAARQRPTPTPSANSQFGTARRAHTPPQLVQYESLQRHASAPQQWGAPAASGGSSVPAAAGQGQGGQQGGHNQWTSQQQQQWMQQQQDQQQFQTRRRAQTTNQNGV